MMKKADKIAHVREAERGGKSALGKALEESLNPESPSAQVILAVADLPAAADYEGHTVYCSNGAAGSPVLAFSDGTNWLRSDTLAAVAAA